MEARIARIESDVAYLRTDVADIKLDLRSLRDKTDAAELVATRETLAASIASAKLWAIVLNIALAAGMFGTMARGFGWI